MVHARQRRSIVAAALLAAVLVPLAAGPSGAETFCSSGPITFTPRSTPTPAVLPYAPYPSTIAVAGLTGTVSDVNVTLADYSFVRPEDADVLLVAPDGTTTLVVMSDSGATTSSPVSPSPMSTSPSTTRPRRPPRPTASW